jgi:methyltransferase-like protein/cyclopropane fatty-acyl-phospholipid synthase-like methyltransferase
MQNALARSYDEAPYDTRPRYSTHPDCLATLATLLGMTPAPVERCRVLELGCGTGGNLLPLAEALPEAQFVGIDLSPRQIDMGRRVAQSLGLNNLQFEARSILDVNESFGTFDYIICHGVYSWAPAEVRDGILRVCQKHLAPQGVALVSYNTYPGWHTRAPIRELMHYHLRDMAGAGAQERASQARAVLQFFMQAVPGGQDSIWARMLHQENESLEKQADFYLLHEHLEENNHPVYFHQFMEHARRFGLQYLGEAGGHLTLSPYPPEVQKALQEMSEDLLALEQYIDFLKCRSFRRTFLVHERVAIQRSPGPDILSRFVLSGLARPRAGQVVNVCDTSVVEFHDADDVTVTTNRPVTKAALMTLFEAWPQSMTFEQVWQGARERLAHDGSGDVGTTALNEEVKAGLAGALVELFLTGLVGFHTYSPPLVTVPGPKPMTTPLTRLQANSGAPLSNRRHLLVEPLGLDRAVLTMLDGEHDRPALVRGLIELVRRGEFEMRRDGEPLTDPDTLADVLGKELEGALQRLALSGLLVR